LNRQHKSCVFDQDFENKLFYFVLNRFYFKNKSGVGVPKFGRKVGVGVLKVKKWEFLKHCLALAPRDVANVAGQSAELDSNSASLLAQKQAKKHYSA